jgi:hypothetical protein
MSFVNRDVQQAFFRVVQFRREKRVAYGAEVQETLNRLLLLDKCLDIICCHDPKIWCRGTGNLLIAPQKQRIQTLSSSRAEDWRFQASREHFFIDFYENIDEKVFGYFARRTLEYRDRMRIFQYEEEERDEIFSEDDIQTFEYLDNMTHQFETLSVQSDLSRRAGIRRYGLLFDNDRNASKCYTDYHIFDEIKASIHNPAIEALRDLLIDMYPLFFINVDDTEATEYRDYFDDQENEQLITQICECKASEGECVVCYEEGKVLELKCHESHTLCNNCIYKIISRGALCPICRQHIFLNRERE